MEKHHLRNIRYGIFFSTCGNDTGNVLRRGYPSRNARSHIVVSNMSITIHTTLGDMKFEIFCDRVPKTSEVYLRSGVHVLVLPNCLLTFAVFRIFWRSLLADTMTRARSIEL